MDLNMGRWVASSRLHTLKNICLNWLNWFLMGGFFLLSPFHYVTGIPNWEDGGGVPPTSWKFAVLTNPPGKNLPSRLPIFQYLQNVFFSSQKKVWMIQITPPQIPHLVPQAIKKIATALHDFTGNFYLI